MEGDAATRGGENVTKTQIPFATHIWNPTVGCTPAGDGCKNCYACRIHNQRHKGWLAEQSSPPSQGAWRMPAQYAKPFNVVQCLPERLDAPLHIRKPARIFVDSMGDLFHEDVPFDFIGKVLDVAARSEQHVLLILTKRWARMRAIVSDLTLARGARVAPNIQLGVSVWDQASADAAWDELRQTPASVSFFSYEPALGPVDFTRMMRNPEYAACRSLPSKLDWLMAGGETGPGARECNTDWIRGAWTQCSDAGVPFFFKQWGDHEVGAEGAHYHDVTRCREYPRAGGANT